MASVVHVRLRRRALRRGLTLIEIIVVMAIMAIVSGVAIGGTMQLPSSRLSRSATMIASAVKVAYTRATATSHDLRLVMDLEHQTVWLEESDIPMLVHSPDPAGRGGFAAVAEAERAAVGEGERVVRMPPAAKARFHPISVYGFGDVQAGKGGKALQTGITFRSVQTAHDDAPRTAGRAYLYFWPGGLTERASVQVRIGDSVSNARTLTLAVAPLTGKVSIKAGSVDLQIPTDDDQKSDRLDTGF